MIQSDAALGAHQLSNLMAYTVFHIGAYITLGVAVIAGGSLKRLDDWSLRWSLVAMIVAGVCGGVIASNIPEFESWTRFVSTPIGPWGLPLMRYAAWATIEHLAFWVGVGLPAIRYLLSKRGDALLRAT